MRAGHTSFTHSVCLGHVLFELLVILFILLTAGLLAADNFIREADESTSEAFAGETHTQHDSNSMRDGDSVSDSWEQCERQQQCESDSNSVSGSESERDSDSVSDQDSERDQ